MMKQTEQSLVERLRMHADLDEVNQIRNKCPQVIRVLREAADRISQLERQLAAPAELPPLPEPDVKCGDYAGPPGEGASEDYYTADQMREYARAAQRAAPTAQPQFCAYCHYDHSVGPLCKQAAIQRQSGAAPQEAPQQEPVAWMTSNGKHFCLASRFMNPENPRAAGMIALYAAPISAKVPE